MKDRREPREWETVGRAILCWPVGFGTCLLVTVVGMGIADSTEGVMLLRKVAPVVVVEAAILFAAGHAGALLGCWLCGWIAPVRGELFVIAGVSGVYVPVAIAGTIEFLNRGYYGGLAMVSGMLLGAGMATYGLWRRGATSQGSYAWHHCDACGEYFGDTLVHLTYGDCFLCRKCKRERDEGRGFEAGLKSGEETGETVSKPDEIEEVAR